jgi:predicted enzyme related to lactoylglutathione lyase
MLNSDEGKVKASNPNHRTGNDTRWDAYICVPSADSIHDELESRGVQIARPIADAPYGLRDLKSRNLTAIFCASGAHCQKPSKQFV